LNFKLKILFLGLLLVLCVNSVSAADSLNNMTLNDDVLLDGSDYVVGETILIDHDVSIAAKDHSTISAENNNVIFNVFSNAKLTLSNLNLTNANGVKGGAIYNNGVLVLNNCTFVNNKATFGGAIYNNGTMILNNCTFESNIASVSGGAIYNLQDDLTIHDSTFIGNYAKIKNGILQGGAIANYANNLTVDNCSFVKNHLFNTNWYKNGKMYGGAIYNSGNNLIVKNSKFNGNYIYGYTDSMNKHVDLSDKYGGAVYSNADISAFLNNEFDSNEIYSMLSSYVTEKVYLSNKGIASAIAAYNKVIIINNTFSNNSAACPPINIDNGERCIILNNTFINIKTGIDVYSNVADGGIVVKGNSINASNIGILLKKGYAIIENNTINADSYGIQFTSADSKNSIVDNNVIISGKDYAISVAGTNTSITDNYIISKDYYGNGAVTSKNNDTLIENNTPVGASIDADISAIINKNATIKIDVLPFDANGNVTIKFNGKSETINFNASQTIVYDLGVLGVGDYEVTVIYNGNAKYNATNITKTFSIGKISDYNVTLNTTDVVAGENSTLVIILPEDATGVVNVTVGKDSYKANVTGGVASVKINSLIAGDYKVNVTYSGDKTYEVSNNVFNLAVNPMKVNLNISDVVMFYRDGTRMVAILTDIKGNPITNATVYFTINGKTYARTTDTNGTASLAINLISKIYNATILYNGSDIYDKLSKNITVTVNPTILANDTVLMYMDGTVFVAKFLDKTGKALTNASVKFNINGVFYTRITDNDGVAKLNIRLRPGSYILTAYNNVTGEEKGFDITVKSLIVANDLTKYYLNATRFEATIYNKNGTLAINKNVTFNINGVFYTRQTNENGVVGLNINLRPGNYIITTMFDGLAIGNNINVLPTLVTNDLSMKYLDGSKFTAQTLDGQGNPLANQNVSFNINGVLYHRVTDKDGMASLNIRLMSGDYIITSYWNDFQVGNTVKIA
jgi:predicted outer membrane repeat protein